MADRIIRETEGGVALVKPVGSIFDPRTLGDGDIIGSTRQVTAPSGLTQFQITLPSGREVESEWLREDQLKKALLPWIETIKQELQADADEVRAKARRAAAERTTQKDSVLVSPSGDALTAGRGAVSPPLSGKPPTKQPLATSTTAAPSSSLSLDPSDFIRESVVRASDELQDAELAAAEAMQRVIEARNNYDKWTKLAEAMGTDEKSNLSDGGGVNPVVSGANGLSKKRGRPPGSRNKPKQLPVRSEGQSEPAK